MPLYKPLAKYQMQIMLSIETMDKKNVAMFTPINGTDIPNLQARIYTQGFMYKNADGTLQLISPLWISTVYFVELKTDQP